MVDGGCGSGGSKWKFVVDFLMVVVAMVVGGNLWLMDGVEVYGC